MKHALIVTLFLCQLPLIAQSISQPREVTYCELSKNPAEFNRTFVRLTGFVTHGLEDFEIHDPACRTQGFSIWLMYGGTAESNTVYCCPGEASRESRGAPVTVEGITLPLEQDQPFQQFRALLRREPDTTASTTLVGTFFSGKRELSGADAIWRGYGHMGCCSLLVIQRVTSFEPHTRTDLDYTAEGGWYEDEGCKWATERDLGHVSVSNWNDGAQKGIEAQKKAEDGEPWAFTNARRVAMESLKALYPDRVQELRRVKNAPARQVFQWNQGKKRTIIVVSRPYWLSFYAKGNAVAWVSTMIKEVECE